MNWSLHIRKEVFQPNESIQTQFTLDLIFNQICLDFSSSKNTTYSTIRWNENDKLKFKQYLDSLGVLNLFSQMKWLDFKSDLKMKIINFVKLLPFYFSRIFQINYESNNNNFNLLSISHSGVRLCRFEYDHKLPLFEHIK